MIEHKIKQWVPAISVGKDGHVYYPDYQRHVIMRVEHGESVVFAGIEDSPGMVNGEGRKATFNYPCGIACAADGIFYVADCNNKVIRRILPTGQVSTLDFGTALRCPTGVNRLADGTLLVLDDGRVIKVSGASL